MKNLALRLKEKEHQRALLTVLTVLMLAILFMLLVSLDAPVEVQEKSEPVEEAIEVSFYEVEMAESGGAEEVASASPIVNEEKVETQTESSTVVTVGESVVEEPDHSLGFTQSEKSGDIKGEFGKDKGVDDSEGRDGVVSTDLGRLVTQPPTFKANAQEEGTIALKIFVDASGKVVRTMVAQEASNSGSTYLINMAREAALTMRYEEKQGVPFEYVGIKLFTFKKV